MILSAHPSQNLNGEIELPGDKSLSHRAALFAALAQGDSHIENFLVAGVTGAMLQALADLGVDWHLRGNSLQVRGRGLRGFRPPPSALDCGSSATTIRLLAGALAASGAPAELDGSPGLRRRPMGRIVEPLRKMGVEIETGSGETAPLLLASRPADRPLQAIDHTLPVASAQVKSCLLLAGLAADGLTCLREPGPSRDHSERMLRSMGVVIENWVENASDESAGEAQYVTQITPPSNTLLHPIDMTIPSDISAAAFLIVAAVLTPGSSLRLPGVGINPTRTGLLDVLQAMGADIRIEGIRDESGEPTADISVRSSLLQGTEVAGPLVVRMIDEFPAFAVAAACAAGRTVVRQAEELRYKESDRIGALCAELRTLGASVEEIQDGFVIEGGELIGGATVDAHGDHRLAMALAVAGLAAQKPVRVGGAEMIAESFPEFVPALQRLGAEIRIED